jgi:Flp pilus assembly protein TadD
MSESPSHADSRSRGLEALQQGDAVAAIAALADHLASEPRDAEACALLGIACSQQLLHAKALFALDRAVQLRPDSAALHFNRGVALERAGRAEAAAEAFQTALRLEPGHSQARTRLEALEPPGDDAEVSDAT